MRLSLLVVGFLFSTLLVIPLDCVEAQTFRYELGRRVKRFELAWEQAEVDARYRSTQPMQAAVTNFFAFKFQKAGRAVDVAFAKVQSATKMPQTGRWALAQKVVVNKRVADSSEGLLELAIEDFYPTDAAIPELARVRTSLRKNPDAELLAEATQALTDESGKVQLVRFELDADRIGEGDFVVTVDLLLDEGAVLPLDAFLFSRINGLADRTNQLSKRIEAVKETGTLTGYQTLRMWADKIRNSMKPERLEIDYPVFQLFENIDALIATKGNSVEFLKAPERQEFWLTFRRDRKMVPLRIRFPNDTTKAAPVLFVFHGAGGSDNMFFETYGAGRCVELAHERGWIVVSPDQGLMSNLQLDCRAMLDILSEHTTVDPERVFFLGHSMGAAQVITQVNANPDLAAAAVALGGGRGQGNAKRLAGIPWFVGAGEVDFGRRGAMALHRSLKDANGNSTYKEYESVEHMVIVQAALDDVFEFLDGVLEKKPADE
jgi:predicted esterase